MTPADKSKFVVKLALPVPCVERLAQAVSNLCSLTQTIISTPFRDPSSVSCLRAYAIYTSDSPWPSAPHPLRSTTP